MADDKVTPGKVDEKTTSGIPRSRPEGSSDKGEVKSSVLQQHIAFFDRDNDGIVTPWDTFVGFRSVGFNLLLSLLAAIFINGTMAYPTQKGYIPDPRFYIHVENINRAKHGSDSEVFDADGEFDSDRFEAFFSKYAVQDETKTTMTPREMFRAIKAHRDVADFFGLTAALLEWTFTYLLIQKNGKMYKDDMRGVIDGSFFYKKSEELRESGGQKAEWQRPEWGDHEKEE